jgi:hypothetical protein
MVSNSQSECSYAVNLQVDIDASDHAIEQERRLFMVPDTLYIGGSAVIPGHCDFGRSLSSFRSANNGSDTLTLVPVVNFLHRTTDFVCVRRPAASKFVWLSSLTFACELCGAAKSKLRVFRNADATKLQLRTKCCRQHYFTGLW